MASNMPSCPLRHHLWLPLALLSCSNWATTSATSLEKTWTLYHSLNGGHDFAKRASVVLSVDPEVEGSLGLTIANDNSTLNQETFQAVKTAGSMYQLKLVEGDNEESATGFLLATVPGCQVMRANFRDELVIHLGPKASAVSLTYMPLVSPLAPKSCDDPFWDDRLVNLPEQGWESRVSWETATPGMVLRPIMPQYRPPPGLKWLPRMGSNGKLFAPKGPPGTAETNGKGGEEAPEVDSGPFGFLRRYWYILLPILILNLMSAEAPAAGPAPAGPGGAAAAAAPVAAASGGPASKQRRGKRG